MKNDSFDGHLSGQVVIPRSMIFFPHPKTCLPGTETWAVLFKLSSLWTLAEYNLGLNIDQMINADRVALIRFQTKRFRSATHGGYCIKCGNDLFFQPDIIHMTIYVWFWNQSDSLPKNVKLTIRYGISIWFISYESDIKGLSRPMWGMSGLKTLNLEPVIVQHEMNRI